MKKITITMLLMMMVSLSHAFTVSNINYTVTSSSDPKTVEIAASPDATGDIVIPETVEDGGITYTVTSIVANAFKDNLAITSFVMANTITNVGQQAFRNCTGLVTVTMSNTLSTLNRVAFFDCSSLKKINFPASITSVADKTWEGCTALDSFIVESATPFVFTNSNFYSSRIGEATLIVPTAQAVTDYGKADYWKDFGSIVQEGALSSQKDITSFAFAEQTSPAVIDAEAHTVNITVLTGSPVTALTPTIVTSASSTISAASGVAGNFSSPVVYTVTAEDASTQDWTITVAQGEVEFFTAGGINYHVTSNTAPYTVEVDVNTGFTGDLNIPETVEVSGKTYKVTSIVASAFAENKVLTSITIGNNVVSIGSRAFIRNQAATSLTIGTSVESIGTLAFFNLLAVTEMTLPASVTSIATRAFEQNAQLTTFTVNNPTPVVIVAEVFTSTSIENVDLVVPDAAAVTAYAAADIWQGFKSIKSSVATGLNKKELSGIKLYPNPANSVINISGIEGNMSVDIYSASGSLLKTSMNSTVDISDLSQGFYFVKAGRHIESFVKK